MKASIIIILVSFSSYIFSQNNVKLDEKNGFKSYKLGTPKSTFKKTLQLDCIDPDNKEFVKELRYRNGCLVQNNNEKVMFSAPIENVWLRFDGEDKLDQIYIDLQKNTSTNFEKLYIDLKDSFGVHSSEKQVKSLTKGTNLKINGKTEVVSEVHLTWKGSKVQLDLEAYYGPSTYTWGIHAKIYNYKDKLDSGF